MVKSGRKVTCRGKNREKSGGELLGDGGVKVEIFLMEKEYEKK